MKRSVLYAAIFIAGVGLFSQAPAQSPAAAKVLTNTVSGRVTSHGKAASGIVVSIRPSDFSTAGAGYKATTDQEGNYHITKVPPGNYQISTVAPVYVDEESDTRLRGGRLLLLGQGEDVTGIDFSIVRGGVITGKLTDTSGRPVVEERIIIMSEDQTRERGRPPVIENSFLTDDRGIYRMYGIPAGRYRIAAGQADGDGYVFTRPGRAMYKRTFYPGTRNPDEAKVVEVTEGGEAQNIDIALENSIPGFSVSGVVVSAENGQPVPGLRFGLRRTEPNNYSIMANNSVSNTRGEFRIDNVMPGKYLVMIMPQVGNEVTADPVPLEVVDQDVSGLTVQTLKGTSISGVVVVEGSNDKDLPSKLAQLRLSVFVRNENGGVGFGNGSFSSIGGDGSFRVAGLSGGTANFNISQQNRNAPGFNIVRIEKDGVALQRNLEIKTGDNITGVRVVLSYGSGSLRGEVKVENGPLPADANMFVALRKADDTQSPFRPYVVDARGHFLIEGITAGSYEVWVSLNRSNRRPPQEKQIVTVTEGAVTDVQLVLDLKATPTPTP